MKPLLILCCLLVPSVAWSQEIPLSPVTPLVPSAASPLRVTTEAITSLQTIGESIGDLGEAVRAQNGRPDVPPEFAAAQKSLSAAISSLNGAGPFSKPHTIQAPLQVALVRSRIAGTRVWLMIARAKFQGFGARFETTLNSLQQAATLLGLGRLEAQEGAAESNEVKRIKDELEVLREFRKKLDEHSKASDAEYLLINTYTTQLLLVSKLQSALRNETRPAERQALQEKLKLAEIEKQNLKQAREEAKQKSDATYLEYKKVSDKFLAMIAPAAPAN